MSNTLRNVLAAVAGIVVGSAVNMALVTLGPVMIPPPEGVDVTSAEGLRTTAHLLEPRHYVMPFLAHALGTFTGALAAWMIAATHRARIAYGIAILFLCGGIAATFMIPAPVAFIATDLLLAYIPMAWLAIRVGSRVEQGRTDMRVKVA